MGAPLVQPQAYYPDGSPIPPEAFAKAAAEGQARFEQGSKVVVRNDLGELKRIDATDIHHPGYTILHPDEVAAIAEHKEYGKGFGNQAKAAGAGVARGLTLGGSDVVASAIGGDETRKSLDALRRQNPITSGVAEVAGAAAPVLLSGGAAAPEEAVALGAGEAIEGASAARGLSGLAGSAIRTAGVAPRATAAAGSLVERGVARGLETLGYEGKTLAGRVAAGAVKSAASGATEGAIYGGAQAMDDSVLKGDKITAEKIVGGMGEGALFGGGIGATLGGLGPLVTGAASKLLPSSEDLEGFARDRALKAVGRDTEKFGKDLPAEQRSALRQTIGDDLKYTLKTGELAGQPVISGGDNVEAIRAKLSQAKREAGAALGGVKEQVNDLMLQKPELAPSMDDLFQRVKEQIIDPLEATKSAGSRAQARAVERELSVLRSEHEARLAEVAASPNYEVNVGAFDKSTMRPESAAAVKANPEAANRLGLPRVDIYEGEPPAITDGRHRMQAAVDRGESSIDATVTHYDREGNIISEGRQPIALTDSGPAKAKGNWAHTSIRELPAPAVGAGPSFLDLDKYRQTLDANLNPKGVPKAMAALGNKNHEALNKTSRVINDYLKEKAEAALAASGEDAGQYRELSRQYFSFNGLEKAADKSVQANARNRSISPSDHAIGLASFLAAAATGNVGALGAMTLGAAGSIANKLIRERGNSMLSVMARKAAALDGSLDAAAKALAGHVDAAKAATISIASTVSNLRGEYQRASERIRELSRPELAQQHVAGLIPEVNAHYPDVGSAIGTQLLGIYQHLSQRLPLSNVSTGDTLTPLAIKDRASVTDMKKFMSNVQGALHPESVIRSLASGKIDRDALDSMKIVYPQMFQQLRTKVSDYVGAREDSLPFTRRLFLSVAFDFVGDSSLEPQRFMELQQTVQQAQGAQPGAAGAPKPKTARPTPSKLGKDFSTPSASAFGA